MDFVPTVSREDVLRIVRRDFPVDRQDEVLRLLDQYACALGPSKPDRVHLAILKLANGDLKRVRGQVRIANHDFRDVLAAAEYPCSLPYCFTGLKHLTDEQKRRLSDDDRRQYEAWLASALSPGKD